MKRIIESTAWSENAIKLISEDWMLIAAGNQEKFNAMTASWGGIGYLWNKPVVFIFVRPERYTFEFLEKFDAFSLTFLPREYKKALGVFGTKSGRNSDKVGESGLNPCFTERGIPYFGEARVVVECKKMVAQNLSEEAFCDPTLLEKWYKEKGGLHKMYVAEILDITEFENE